MSDQGNAVDFIGLNKTKFSCTKICNKSISLVAKIYYEIDASQL